MSDTTEAMRAAFDKWYDASAFRRSYDKYGPTEVAFEVWQAACKSRAPAAPAVTDSTHTGAGLGHAAGCTSQQSAHAKCDCGYEGSALRGTALDVDHRMRQPSPERNDCEPVAPGVWVWSSGNSYALVRVDRRPSAHSPGGVLNGHVLQSTPFYDGCPVASWGADGTWTSISDSASRAAPPPPAERHYCERCKGSGEDPEGYFDQSRGPDGGTHDGPCRDCDGTGARKDCGHHLTQQQIASLQSVALTVFDGPETPQAVRDVIEWFASMLTVQSEAGSTLGVHTCTPPGDAS